VATLKLLLVYIMVKKAGGENLKDETIEPLLHKVTPP
jgi:hypothetical protein